MQETVTQPAARPPVGASLREGTRHVLSFGGGVNSVALMVLLLDQGMPLDEAVFADTGAEVPETYEYLEIARAYLESRGVPLTTVQKRGDDLLATCKRRKVIPSALWRWSTRDFKVRPIHAYYKSLRTNIVQYVAIAYDELERMRTNEADWIQTEYPLVDGRVTRDGCLDIIRAAGLPEPVKSGCYFCPFNSLARWRWLKDNHPPLYANAIELEEGSKHFPAQRLTDQVFRRRAAVTLRELPEHSRYAALPVTELPCGGECHT